MVWLESEEAEGIRSDKHNRHCANSFNRTRYASAANRKWKGSGEYIFEQIPNASKEIEFNIKCNYFQIYNEKIQDLLDTRKTDLSIREDKVNNKGIWVEDLTEICVSSEEEMNEVFYTGSHNRAVSATEMNKGSSRSHSLFVITIFQRILLMFLLKQEKFILLI